MKVMRIMIFVAIVFFSLFLFVTWGIEGGNGFEETNINGYREFEKYEGESELKIFPESLPDILLEADYYYRYRDGIFGPSSQIYLKCMLTERDFKIELNRVSKLAHDTSTDFSSLPAYIINYDEENIYEYVLYDEASFTIHYIYLERFAKHMIKFDKTLLPDDYSKAWFLR
jgi:hypothetical protein